MTLEVLSFRQDHTGKWRAVRCGYAKRNKDGDLNVYLDAIPAPRDSQWSLVIKPRREQQQYGDVASGDQAPQGVPADLEDSIPF